jgi:hypothetical protein
LRPKSASDRSATLKSVVVSVMTAAPLCG